MRLAISFPNFGPYHRARLQALGDALGRDGGSLVAHEMAGSEAKYPWTVGGEARAFTRRTLFPDRAIEEVAPAECRAAMRDALDDDRPDAVAICGYARPEAMAALRWAELNGKPAVLMSESQEIDRPRLWWRESVKSRRVRRFSSAVVGGPRHRDYLATLGIPAERIALGYNAVDNAAFAAMADAARRAPRGREGLPTANYFLCVGRFVPEKNLTRLVRTFAAYRREAGAGAWDLALCGGGPIEAEIVALAGSLGIAGAVHRPGFLHGEALARWYAFAGAFVLPSLSEPWGLVANEAAACGVPLMISERAGCVDTLVPDSAGTTGVRFDPEDEAEIAGRLAWMAARPAWDRLRMGATAACAVADWGPERFARGVLEAVSLARPARARRRRRSTGGTR